MEVGGWFDVIFRIIFRFHPGIVMELKKWNHYVVVFEVPNPVLCSRALHHG